MTKLRKNERSWAIELINQINAIADKNDLIIKRANGEITISQEKVHMFPDVLLFADRDLNEILQGWELKMPDVPITDDVFVKDAQRKAIALGLDSCVIWNFTYAKFYVYNEKSKEFDVAQTWNNPTIVDREDVTTYRHLWEKTLESVVLTVNEYLCTHTLKKTSIEELISDKAISMLVNNNKAAVAKNYKEEANKNSVIGAFINQWWNDIKIEYQFDETDAYQAYSKNIILNWAYRITFAHLIKRHQSEAMIIDHLDYDSTTDDANKLFAKITSKCDFYNVFEEPQYSSLLPIFTWHSLIEFSLFLKEHTFNNINQTLLQSILEGTINTTHREMNGQFTTDKELAKILTAITVHDWTDDTIDPCCGTATIPHAIIESKKGKIGSSRAVETTWASDKYQMPLQIANISMTSYDTMNLANRLFKKNVFELEPGESIEIVDPRNGEKVSVEIPKFSAICSNLPFVSFENIPADDFKYTTHIGAKTKISSKADLSYYIALHLSKLLKDHGYLGIILSNSWLGTEAGDSFYHALLRYYHLLQVHISGKGRWFKNADVVTTILLLQKKGDNETNANTSFFIWHKSLDSIKEDISAENTIVNSSLLNKVIDRSVLSLSKYSPKQIEDLHNLNMSYNALFHDISWLLDIQDTLVPLTSEFDIIRGSRRGWDPMFFPNKENDIEQEFIHPALKNGDNISSLIATPDRDAFCCGLPLEELQIKYPNAYRWIKKFEGLNNTKKVNPEPLPVVLLRSAKKGDYWYQMRPKETADLVTLLNPNKKLYFARFKEPSFINQRLFGLKFKKKGTDKELCHALLNTVLMQFYIEATGFGRGLGVLDMSKTNLSKGYMLDPNTLSRSAVNEIKNAFRKVSNKKIKEVEACLNDEDWQFFNHTVFKAYGIDEYYDRICASLTSMMRARLTVNEKPPKAKLKTMHKEGYTSEDSYYDMAAESKKDDK